MVHCIQQGMYLPKSSSSQVGPAPQNHSLCHPEQLHMSYFISPTIIEGQTETRSKAQSTGYFRLN